MATKASEETYFWIRTSDGELDLYVTAADSKDKMTDDPRMARPFSTYAEAHQALCQFARTEWHPLNGGSDLFQRADVEKAKIELTWRGRI
jgi:hypothetical protein